MTDESQTVETLMMGLHSEFEQLFRSHQIALLDRDAEQALSLLSRYRDVLVAHIEDEETLILPVFAARGGEDLNSPPRQFLGEHQKIRDCLDEFLDRCEAWQRSESDDDLLALLDREAWFKNLMVHHDLREAKVLYPRFEAWSTASELRDVFARISLRSLR